MCALKKKAANTESLQNFRISAKIAAMEDLKNMLKNRLQQTPIGQSAATALVVEQAQAVFDEQFGATPQLVRVLYLKNRTLTVSVSGSPVAHEVKRLEKELLKKLCAATGDQSIERIRYLL